MSVNHENEVSREDQTLINRFARLNANADELEQELQDKRRQLENAQTAQDELCLQDERVLVHAGEVLASMSVDAAEQWCERLKLQLQQSLEQQEQRVETMRAEMSTIKTRLYARFGQNINLESDE